MNSAFCIPKQAKSRWYGIHRASNTLISHRPNVEEIESNGNREGGAMARSLALLDRSYAMDAASTPGTEETNYSEADIVSQADDDDIQEQADDVLTAGVNTELGADLVIQTTKGVWFTKENETSAYQYMWESSVTENIEYSAHIFKDGVFVQKGIDEFTSQRINLIKGNEFGENYFKIGNIKKSLIGHIHTHQTNSSAMIGVKGFSQYSGDDLIIANSNGLTFFLINAYGGFYAASGTRNKSWGYLKLPTSKRSDLLNGNFSIINYMLKDH